MTDPRPLPRLEDYRRHVARHGQRLLGWALLGALLGAVMFLAVPNRYLATARIAVSPQLSYVSLAEDSERQPLVTLDTTAAMLESDETLTSMAKAMKVTSDEAMDSMTISAKPLSRVLIIQIRAASEEAARDGMKAATTSLFRLQRETFALDRKRVRILRNRVALVRASAQELIASGSPAQRILEDLAVLQTRLDRAITTNNTQSMVLGAHLFEYRPGQAEVFIASGFTIGLFVGVGSLGQVVPTAGPRRRATGP